jgi:PAS domain S-box-containing protein
MGSVSRPVKAGDARRVIESRRRIRSVKRNPSGAATTAADTRVTLADAILGSLSERVAVIDPDGTIVAINSAWTTFPMPIKALELVRPGKNYFELCRRAVIDGHAQFAAVVDGVQAVTQGRVPRYHATVPSPHSNGDGSFLVTATPLHQVAGGAVITHAHVVPETISALAQRIGETHFYSLTDAIPIPVWIQDAAGRVIHGNGRWRQIAAADRKMAGGNAHWIDIVHPDDRARGAAAFEEAFASRQTMVRELRTKAADGTFRWSLCSGAPFGGVDGRLDGYICSCFDVGAQRNAEWALNEMSAKLMAAQEEERSRIGRELHDDLGQQAALLAATIETLLQAKSTSTEHLRAGIREARGRVQDLAVSIHNLSHELHPPKLKLLGLVKTLQALCRDVAKESGKQVTFQAGNVPSDIPERIALCACRVAQEALRNAVNHSGARTIDVSLTTAPSELSLTIADSGHGFDLATPATGIGLLSMRERVELNAGRMVVETSPRGTTIVVSLPIKPPGAVVASHEMRSSLDRQS